MQEFLLHAYYTSLVIITLFTFLLLFSKKVRTWIYNLIFENRFFNWGQPPYPYGMVKTNETQEDTKTAKPSTDQSIDYLTRRINQLQSDLDKIKKDNWLNSNPRKFNYGDKVIFNGKECQVIEYKVHPSTIGFSWVYRLLEVGGTIVTHYKHGYLTSDVQVGNEFQFESEISKVEKPKKTKKKK